MEGETYIRSLIKELVRTRTTRVTRSPLVIINCPRRQCNSSAWALVK
ncbi:hypothetical protein [Candidatus Methanodesulfokora washburnensis]|nr:hypothetical protein [Candidatus Methanodesulfokores washburnensis]